MSTLNDAINKAVFAHSNWKFRLNKAIEQGTFELKVEEVKNDSFCDFGKWLSEYDFPANIRSNAEFNTIIKLHKEFHLLAANIVNLAVTGKKEEAQKLMAFGSEYSQVSSDLIKRLNEWKSKIS